MDVSIPGVRWPALRPRHPWSVPLLPPSTLPVRPLCGPRPGSRAKGQPPKVSKYLCWTALRGAQRRPCPTDTVIFSLDDQLAAPPTRSYRRPPGRGANRDEVPRRGASGSARSPQEPAATLPKISKWDETSPLKLKPGAGLQDSRGFSVLWGHEKTTFCPRRRCPGRGDLPHHPQPGSSCDPACCSTRSSSAFSAEPNGSTRLGFVVMFWLATSSRRRCRPKPRHHPRLQFNVHERLHEGAPEACRC